VHSVKLKCTKSFVGWDSAPDHTRMIYSAPLTSLLDSRGEATSKEEEGRGRGGSKRKGEGRGRRSSCSDVTIWPPKVQLAPCRNRKCTDDCTYFRPKPNVKLCNIGPSNHFTLLNGCTGKCVRPSRLLAFECTLNHCTFHFISFHNR